MGTTGGGKLTLRELTLISKTGVEIQREEVRKEGRHEDRGVERGNVLISERNLPPLGKDRSFRVSMPQTRDSSYSIQL